MKTKKMFAEFTVGSLLQWFSNLAEHLVEPFEKILILKYLHQRFGIRRSNMNMCLWRPDMFHKDADVH